MLYPASSPEMGSDPVQREEDGDHDDNEDDDFDNSTLSCNLTS